MGRRGKRQVRERSESPEEDKDEHFDGERTEQGVESAPAQAKANNPSNPNIPKKKAKINGAGSIAGSASAPLAQANVNQKNVKLSQELSKGKGKQTVKEKEKQTVHEQDANQVDESVKETTKPKQDKKKWEHWEVLTLLKLRFAVMKDAFLKAKKTAEKKNAFDELALDMETAWRKKELKDKVDRYTYRDRIPSAQQVKEKIRKLRAEFTSECAALSSTGNPQSTLNTEKQEIFDLMDSLLTTTGERKDSLGSTRMGIIKPTKDNGASDMSSSENGSESYDFDESEEEVTFSDERDKAGQYERATEDPGEGTSSSVFKPVSLKDPEVIEKAANIPIPGSSSGKRSSKKDRNNDKQASLSRAIEKLAKSVGGVKKLELSFSKGHNPVTVLGNNAGIPGAEGPSTYTEADKLAKVESEVSDMKSCINDLKNMKSSINDLKNMSHFWWDRRGMFLPRKHRRRMCLPRKRIPNRGLKKASKFFNHRKGPAAQPERNL
eukprot:Nk52_evm7s2273 gene=Nk52_evmTU7s2273